MEAWRLAEMIHRLPDVTYNERFPLVTQQACVEAFRAYIRNVIESSASSDLKRGTSVAPASPSPMGSAPVTTHAAPPPIATLAAPPSPPAALATTPAAGPVVEPGTICSNAGTEGASSAGKTYVCTTSDTDSRFRWRTA